MNRDELRNHVERDKNSGWYYVARVKHDTILELLDTVEGLVGALKDSPCPAGVLPRTVKECTDSDSCVCYNETVLAKAKEE